MAQKIVRATFDPYQVWFKIPPSEQPPDHYQLLGLDRSESDNETIVAAGRERITVVREHFGTAHGKIARRLTEELLHAVKLLCDAKAREAYDQSLGKLPATGDPSATDAASQQLAEHVESTSIVIQPIETGTVQKKNRSTKSPLRQVIETVVGGLAAIPLTLLLLNYVFHQDPIGIFPARSSLPIAAAPVQEIPLDPKPSQASPSASDHGTTNVPAAEPISPAITSAMPPAPAAANSEAAAKDAATPIVPSRKSDEDSLVYMQAMPPPSVSGTAKWLLDGEQLVTDETDVNGRYLFFGDPTWEEYDFKVKAISEITSSDAPKKVENMILFLAQPEMKNHWRLYLWASGDSKNVGLLPFVDGSKDPWQDPARRFMRIDLPARQDIWNSIEIKVRRTKVTVTVDGQSITTEHPTLSQGRVGIGSEGVGRSRWRNCEVRSPEGTLLWQGWPPLSVTSQAVALDRTPIPPPTPEPAPASVVVERPQEPKKSVDSATKAIDRLKDDFENYDKQLAAANKAMLESFDETILKVRAAKNWPGSDRLALIERIKQERAAFEKTGYLPFSEPMRVSLLEYVARRNRADQVLGSVLDRQIVAFVKAKDNVSADLVEKERERRLSPQTIARWQCPHWQVTIYSNGTALGPLGTAPWQLSGNKMTITWTDRHLRKKFTDTCILTPLGNHFDARNQEGFRFSADALGP